MYRPAPIGMILILWFIGEYIAFAYVVSLIGLSGALLIGILTFLVGINTLRQLGLSALSQIRQQVNQTEIRSTTGAEPVLHSIGALLLIIPGFLSDMIGLALLAPSLRGWLVSSQKQPLSGTRPKANPDIIDLDESSWRRIDDS